MCNKNGRNDPFILMHMTYDQKYRDPKNMRNHFKNNNKCSLDTPSVESCVRKIYLKIIPRKINSNITQYHSGTITK